MLRKDALNAELITLEFAPRPIIHVRWPPPHAETDKGWQNSLTNTVVQSCITAAGKLDAAVREAMKDETMSALGRMRKVQPELDAALAAINAGRDKLGVEKGRIDRERGQLSNGLPPLAAGDLVAAMREREVRDDYPKLQEGQRAALVDQMRRGEADEVLFALARDPLPNNMDSQMARAILKDRAETKNAGALETLDADEDAVTWALSVLQQIEAVIGKADNYGLGGDGGFAPRDVKLPAKVA